MKYEDCTIFDAETGEGWVVIKTKSDGSYVLMGPPGPKGNYPEYNWSESFIDELIADGTMGCWKDERSVS